MGLSDTLDTTPAELIPLVKEFGFEGIIASGETPVTRYASDPAMWLKYKVRESQSALMVCTR